MSSSHLPRIRNQESNTHIESARVNEKSKTSQMDYREWRMENSTVESCREVTHLAQKMGKDTGEIPMPQRVPTCQGKRESQDAPCWFLRQSGGQVTRVIRVEIGGGAQGSHCSPTGQKYLQFLIIGINQQAVSCWWKTVRRIIMRGRRVYANKDTKTKCTTSEFHCP